MSPIDHALLNAARDIVFALMPLAGKTPEKIKAEIWSVYSELMEPAPSSSDPVPDDALEPGTGLMREASICRFLERWCRESDAEAEAETKSESLLEVP